MRLSEAVPIQPGSRDAAGPSAAAGPRVITPKVRRRSWGEPAVRASWLLALGLLLATSWLVIEQALVLRSSRWRIEHWILIPKARIEKIGLTTRDTYRPPMDQLVVMETTISYLTADGQKHELTGRLTAQKTPVRPTDEIPILINPANPSEWTDRVATDSFFQELMVPSLLSLPVIFGLAALWQRQRVLNLWRTGTARQATVIDTRHSAAAPRSMIVRCTLADKRDKRILSVTIPRSVTRLKPGDPLVLVTPPGEPSWAIAAMLYE